jgi:hypothetical protein
MRRVLTALPCVTSCSLSDVYKPFACVQGGLFGTARFPELLYVLAPSQNTVIFIVTVLESSDVMEINLFLQTHINP